ncbi:MAG: SufD family Fe-S cluster assembly protein [Candidatus Micrarchaeia archaeon]
MLEWLEDFEELEKERAELYKRHSRLIPIRPKNSSGREKRTGREYDIMAFSSEHAASVESKNISIASDAEIISLTENIDNPLTINIEGGKEATMSLAFNFDSSLPSKIKIRLGKQASLNIYETFSSDFSSDGILLQEIDLDDSSKLNLVALHKEPESANYALLSLVHSGKRAEARLTNVFAGGNKLHHGTIGVAEDDGSITSSTVAIAGSSQTIDASSLLVNEGHKSSIDSLTRAVVKDNAECLVKELAKVRQNAEEASTYIEEKGLLLNNSASFVPMPDMAVDTNNVANASHSSAVFPLSKKSVFYIMSRGVSEGNARQLFATGFLEKLLAGKFEGERGKIMLEEVKASLNSKLRS